MRALLVLLPLLLVVLVVWLVVRSEAGRPRVSTGAGGDVAPRPVDPRVAEVRELAWDHRELDPELAGALIARIREADPEVGDPRLLDDLRELAWEHRDGSPDLSVIVIDTIRRGGPDDAPRRL